MEPIISQMPRSLASLEKCGTPGWSCSAGVLASDFARLGSISVVFSGVITRSAPAAAAARIHWVAVAMFGAISGAEFN